MERQSDKLPELKLQLKTPNDTMTDKINARCKMA